MDEDSRRTVLFAPINDQLGVVVFQEVYSNKPIINEDVGVIDWNHFLHLVETIKDLFGGSLELDIVGNNWDGDFENSEDWHSTGRLGNDLGRDHRFTGSRISGDHEDGVLVEETADQGFADELGSMNRFDESGSIERRIERGSGLHRNNCNG